MQSLRGDRFADANVRAFCCAGFLRSSPVQKSNKITADEVMQKDNSKSQARTEADSEQNDQDLFVSQHSRKPPVVGSQCTNVSTESF